VEGRSVADAGQDAACPAGLDAHYEHLRHAVLHEPAHAFPLGLGVLIARGVTAWARALTHPSGPAPSRPAPSHPAPSGAGPGPADIPRLDRLPSAAATQLVHALAGLAVALAGT